MHSVLLNVTKTTFAPFVYIGIYVDRVMKIDNTQWFSIHYYVFQVQRGFQSSFELKQLGSLPILTTYFALLVEGYLDFGGLGLEELGAKLVNMGYDGSTMFQGHRISVIL